ncbi:MAG: signal recognition particle-docking protein FtsY [Gemmatimonadota bacterium]
MARLFQRSGDVPKRTLWQRIKDIALADVTVVARPGARRSVEGSLERLEEILLDADFGVNTTLRMVADVERMAQRGDVRTEEEFLGALRHGITSALQSGNADPSLHYAPNAPTVYVVIGVNGAGKTTFIGKLAAQLRRDGKKVLLAAGDTFRAGAIDQLRLWAERVGVDFVGGQAGGDAAAVAFDAIDAAITRGIDVVIVDTAGRLHTSANLMDELKKVVRVIQKRLPDAPHETLLVLDGTIGQNAIAQAKTFASAVPVTGLVVTKVDGTAKGGIVVAVHEAIDVPVKFIGVGEKVGDLERFDASEFATELLAS